MLPLLLGLALAAPDDAPPAAPPASPPADAPAAPAAPPAAAPSTAPASGEPATPAEPPASKARLPSPLSVPNAPYPAEALAAGQEAAVLLEVTVAADGTVPRVAVRESAGAAFDAGAMAALRAARFTPPLDDAGEPAAAVILYRYRFTLATVATVSAEGTVKLADGTPVPAVEVRALREGETRYATTDDNGAFRFADLASGEWTVVMQSLSLETATAPFTVTAGQVAVVTLVTRIPEPDPVKVRGATILVEADAISTEVSERKLSAAEIAYLPGTNGDVVKVVQNLPGVSRPPLGTGNLIIRGTSPEDSAAYLDGSRIPVVFHFGGLTTVINGNLLEEVSFVPGNASARYGRFLGGMVELRTKPDAPTGQHGQAQIDLYQATLFVESAIAKDAGVTLSLRRSYADAVLVPIFSSIPGVDIQAPRYFDIQARAQAKVGATKVEGLLTLSDDTFALVGDSEGTEDGAVQIGLSTNFWRARLSGLTELNDGWHNELRLGTGYDAQEFKFDTTGTARESNTAFTLREELSRPVENGRMVGWRFGIDAEAGPQEFLYDVKSFGAKEAGSALRFAPAAYAEATLQLGPVRVIPGVRADAMILDSDYANVTVDPRLSGRWAITETTALRFGVGRYSQYPTVRQLLPDGDGNPDLGPAWALQSSLGVDQELFSMLHVEATVFYNHLDDLVVGREDRIKFFTGPPNFGPKDTDPYANDGTGRVCGGELLLRLDAPKTLALLSLTVSNSARVKRPGDAEVLFEYDQPVVLNVLGSRDLGKGWRAGARVRYGSGDPYTPVTNRFYDMSSRSFLPIYDESASDRLPDFFSLDVRIDKRWTVKWGEIAAYLDVQNATYAQNVEVMRWNYDYTEADPVTGLPTFPTFGLEAKW